MFKERRLFPRSDVDIPVQLIVNAPGGDTEFPSQAVNLSQNGVHIRCTQEAVAFLKAREDYPPTCGLRFQLPEGSRTISCRCRLVVIRRLAQNRYHLGLNFVTFDASGKQALAEFLAVPTHSATM